MVKIKCNISILFVNIYHCLDFRSERFDGKNWYMCQSMPGGSSGLGLTAAENYFTLSADMQYAYIDQKKKERQEYMERLWTEDKIFCGVQGKSIDVYAIPDINYNASEAHCHVIHNCRTLVTMANKLIKSY